MGANTTIGEWVIRAGEGDRHAWDQLVAEFSPMIWNVVRSYRLSYADAADAHAMTWIRLLDNILRIREPDRIAGWLSRTAGNEALSIIRKNARVLTIEPNQLDRQADGAVEPGADLMIEEDVKAVREAIRQIGDPCAQLLRLLYAEPELSYAEVAEILDRPVGSIGPTRQRCLEKLRVTLSKEVSHDI